MGSTAANDQSSRSHTIFRMVIESKLSSSANKENSNLRNNRRSLRVKNDDDEEGAVQVSMLVC